MSAKALLESVISSTMFASLRKVMGSVTQVIDQKKYPDIGKYCCLKISTFTDQCPKSGMQNFASRKVIPA